MMSEVKRNIKGNVGIIWRIPMFRFPRYAYEIEDNKRKGNYLREIFFNP